MLLVFGAFSLIQNTVCCSVCVRALFDLCYDVLMRLQQLAIMMKKKNDHKSIQREKQAVRKGETSDNLIGENKDVIHTLWLLLHCSLSNSKSCFLST